jgi:cysteine desulfurase family protein (TIGR01976 family)
MPGTAPVDTSRAVKSVVEIRADFPALARRHADRPVAYFDGPGGTQVPRPVIDAVNDYLTAHNANTHWAYPASTETDAIIEHAREQAALFLNASIDEVAFGPNMTTLTFHLSRALGRQFHRGDVIVVTDLDHHANIDPWRALAREREVTIRRVPFDPGAATLDWDALERALDDDARLLAIGAASNALGTVTDVRLAGELAHAHGALVFVDAVHYAPHRLVDVQDLDCDFLACSAYKFYGPHLGLLYGRRDVLERLEVPKLDPAPEGPAERFELGTSSHEAIAGTAAAIGYLQSLCPEASGRAALHAAYGAIHARESALLQRLWNGLSALDGVRLYGVAPTAARTPTVAFTVEGHDSESVARTLAKEALFLSHGDFYALTAVRRLGLEAEGLVRAGCACYTTDEEVDRLVEGVRALTRARR